MRRTPIALQVVAMMLVGVLASQVITVAIVLLLPPQHRPTLPASVLAAGLNTGRAPPGENRGLSVITGGAPPLAPRPDVAHRDRFNEARLSALLHRPIDDVRFYFIHDPHWLESITELWRPAPVRPMEGRPRPFPRPFLHHHRRGFRPGSTPGAPDAPADPSAGAAPGTAPAPPPEPPPPGLSGAGNPEGPAQGPGDPGAGFFRPPSGWLVDPDYQFFGNFIASARDSSGHWVTVTAVQERLLDAWQLRMVLWLAASGLLIAAGGYLFARRITAPLATFADAARRLGSDPNAPPLLLHGPAELGDAAEAFNDMQTRLSRYIADRTAMFSAISHDLRTPLARILFKMERWPGPLSDSIRPDIAQMEEMIGSVLKFMREGQFPGARERLDLGSLVERVVDEATEGGGTATLAEPEPLIVSGDSAALRRMLANLISNAVRYGGAASVSLRQDGDEAVVEIEDEGPGIPDSELERVFEPFYRADRSRNLNTTGIGLGLAISRTIAREHGGDIVLQPRPVGLTAVVRLPLDTGESPRLVKPKSAPAFYPEASA